MSNDISTCKAELRRTMRTQRATQDPAQGNGLKNIVLASGLIPPHAVIGGFMPMRGEINILPLLHELHRRNHRLALPETPPTGQALIFRAWTPDTQLRVGRFGTEYPDTPPLQPDFLLVPLLAFDLHGNRLGYGAGHYDRTIATILPDAFRLGCAYAMQQVEHIPTEPTDQPLHAVATEHAIIKFL